MQRRESMPRRPKVSRKADRLARGEDVPNNPNDFFFHLRAAILLSQSIAPATTVRRFAPSKYEARRTSVFLRHGGVMSKKSVGARKVDLRSKLEKLEDR